MRSVTLSLLSLSLSLSLHRSLFTNIKTSNLFHSDININININIYISININIYTYTYINISLFCRNGDYAPNRFQAQNDAVSMVFNSKTGSNPENTCGVMSMAGQR
jgi:hypothetical protein